MKNNNSRVLWLSRVGRVFFSVAFVVLWTACSDEVVPLSQHKSEAVLNSALRVGSNNSISSMGDYNISLTTAGLTWTYVITKNQGAKNLSHFILNFYNCGSSSATIDNIVWATVNGLPATMQSSEGKTGCNVASVTTDFVKFDNLPDADMYTIVFETDKLFGHFVGTTAWLKAGTSCFTYPVLAPCCPL